MRANKVHPFILVDILCIHEHQGQRYSVTVAYGVVVGEMMNHFLSQSNYLSLAHSQYIM